MFVVKSWREPTQLVVQGRVQKVEGDRSPWLLIAPIACAIPPTIHIHDDDDERMAFKLPPLPVVWLSTWVTWLPAFSSTKNSSLRCLWPLKPQQIMDTLNPLRSDVHSV